MNLKQSLHAPLQIPFQSFPEKMSNWQKIEIGQNEANVEINF